MWLTYYPNIMLEWYPHVLVISTLIPEAVDRTLNVVEFYYPEEIALFEREFVEAEQAAYRETAKEDDEIAERMDAGRRALYRSGRNEVGPYQSPMEDGMQHFHEFYRREMEAHLADRSVMTRARQSCRIASDRKHERLDCASCSTRSSRPANSRASRDGRTSSSATCGTISRSRTRGARRSTAPATFRAPCSFTSIATFPAPKTGTNGRHPLPSPEAAAALFGRLGIADGKQVVAYDQGGGMFAARLWWMLRWLGFEAAAVLDGGYAKWVAEGRAIDDRCRAPAPRRVHGPSASRRPSMRPA